VVTINISRGILRTEAVMIRDINTSLLGFLLSIQPAIKSTSPRITTSIPGMSESIPQSPYSSGVSRKAIRPIPIRKNEATMSLPNLLIPFSIRFILHPYPSLPLKGEGILFYFSLSPALSLKGEGVWGSPASYPLSQNKSSIGCVPTLPPSEEGIDAC
jgi:hypothetical protein